MRVLLTGANGFVAKNLSIHLQERSIDILGVTRDEPLSSLSPELDNIDFVFHLAGVNRPKDVSEFSQGNTELTEQLCDLIRRSCKKIPVLYTSSIQAELDNSYGLSKLAAEDALVKLNEDTGSPVYLYRLPNVFGKWSRPNYNSAVATFCHNIANDLPIQINDPNSEVTLVYVDDLIKEFITLMEDQPGGVQRPLLTGLFKITVGDLAGQINAFKDSRDLGVAERVGSGLTRALYATYLSFLRPSQFSYTLHAHTDPRGRFAEVLKTKDSGQFSFFTAHPGVTRGGHYHHTKNEKFLVIQGKAKFGFRHIVTDETYELYTDGSSLEVVETVPGWSHDITNVGEEEMIVMLWANEEFDRNQPDTVQYRV